MSGRGGTLERKVLPPGRVRFPAVRLAGSTSNEADRESDLARVCLHEYAHLVVARQLGAMGFVRVARIFASRDAGPHFAGRFELHEPLGADQLRMVALAGSIAEIVEPTPSIGPADVAARLASGPSRLSGADATLAAGYVADDVARTLSLVRELWPMIRDEAAARCAELEAMGACRWD
jgi:hypothetical protein